MSLFYWDTRLETGDARIDEQHKRLFELTNDIAAILGGRGALPKISVLVAELMDYARTHFCDEEKLLCASSLSPGAQERHVCAHRDFIERVEAIAARTDLPPTEVVSEFLEFLVNWLVTHILKMDHRMALALPDRDLERARALVPAISVEKVLMAALRETERRFRLLAEQAPTMIWFCGLSGVREFVNKGWCDFVGIDAGEVAGIDWMALIHPDDREPYQRFLARLLETRDLGEMEYRVRGASGDWTWVLERVMQRVDRETCVGLVAAATDVTAIKSLNEVLEQEVAERTRRLEVLAGTDALTGLYNRRTLDARLAGEIHRAQRYRRPLSLLFLDIDHFKRINDGFGHAAGDRVLVAIARALERRMRATDLVVRLGGEEFVVLLIETHLGEAATIADLLREMVMGLTFEAIPEVVTISVGVTTLASSDDVGSFLARADRALLAAKRGGRNRCRVRPPRNEAVAGFEPASKHPPNDQGA